MNRSVRVRKIPQGGFAVLEIHCFIALETARLSIQRLMHFGNSASAVLKYDDSSLSCFATIILSKKTPLHFQRRILGVVHIPHGEFFPTILNSRQRIPFFTFVNFQHSSLFRNSE